MPAALDRRHHLGIRDRAGDALALQGELGLVDAARGVGAQDQSEIDISPVLCRGADGDCADEGQGECCNLVSLHLWSPAWWDDILMPRKRLRIQEALQHIR